VRVSLLTTLIVSLALHLAVAGGIALSFFHSAPVRHTTPASLAPMRMVLVRSSALQLPIPLPVPAKPAPAVSISEPALPAHNFAKTTTVAVSKPAPEANPNAHLPTPAPEAILSPVPPPLLNAADGVVFMLDVSGSMYESYAGSTRLTYAREILSGRIRALKNGTPFAIVLYSQQARASGPLVAASDATREAAVRFILRDVDCGGGTNLPEGLSVARHLCTGDIVLASDGDLNTTVQNLSTRTRAILGEAKKGPNLEVIGIAPRVTENADQLLAALAAQQGGTYQIDQPEGNTGLLTSRAKSPDGK
jgi:von Willebrand factor type A domain